ncbi:MAG: peptidoglycan DD-metalloendopeptidase family protein [Candidatus Sumerlaeaceae bacterium]|nr:peptidoglycan DD-metalloendopeptidase family protein [Candidatus Sumerlaeaceae bacterium]
MAVLFSYGAKPSPSVKSGVVKSSGGRTTARGTPSARLTTSSSSIRRQSPTKQSVVGKDPKSGTVKPSSAPVSGKNKAHGSAATTSVAQERGYFLRLADPYEMSRFFRSWWSLTEVEVDPQSGKMWQRHAREQSLKQLGEILGDVMRAYEHRRMNARRASIALYLAGRLRQQSMAIPPAPVIYHTIALRRSMIKDAVALDGYAQLEELLRGAEAQMLEPVDKLHEAVGTAANESITVAFIDTVVAWNHQLLAGCYPRNLPEILQLKQSLGASEKALVSLREFGPPMPEVSVAYWPLVGEDLPLPHEQLPPPRRNMTHEKMATPAQQALTLRVRSGQPIRCAADGIVRFAGEMRGLDHVVIVEHAQGRLSVYGLLGEVLVKADQKIGEGECVGLAERGGEDGTTEIIFEVREGVKPASPRLLLGERDPYSVIVREQ